MQGSTPNNRPKDFILMLTFYLIVQDMGIAISIILFLNISRWLSDILFIVLIKDLSTLERGLILIDLRLSVRTTYQAASTL